MRHKQYELIFVIKPYRLEKINREWFKDIKKIACYTLLADLLEINTFKKESKHFVGSPSDDVDASTGTRKLVVPCRVH